MKTVSVEIIKRGTYYTLRLLETTEIELPISPDQRKRLQEMEIPVYDNNEEKYIITK